MFALQAVVTQVGMCQHQHILSVAEFQSSRSPFYFFSATIFFCNIFFFWILGLRTAPFSIIWPLSATLTVFSWPLPAPLQRLSCSSFSKVIIFLWSLSPGCKDVLHGNQALGSESQTPGMRGTGKGTWQLVAGEHLYRQDSVCPWGTSLTKLAACRSPSPLPFLPPVSKTVNQYVVSQIG